jgi:hypothetical protein
MAQELITVSNTDFLSELSKAVPDGSCMWVNKFHGNPNGDDAKWSGMVYTPKDHTRSMCDQWAEFNTYFSVASVKTDDDGMYKRRKSTFTRMLALVVDDVDLNSLLSPPSWVLETSPGNTQAGYFLDENDPDCANEVLCSSVVKSMTMRGFIGGDVSGNNSVRYVRLPVGTNQKPRVTGHYRHKLLHWNPEIRLTLKEACSAVGMDLSSVSNASKIATQSLAPTSGLMSGSQDEKLASAVEAVLDGQFHEPLNIIAASLISTGAHPASVTNMLRGLMNAYSGDKDDRWMSRYKDIPRAVKTAEEKYKPKQSQTIDYSTGEILPDVIKEPIFEHVGSSLDEIKEIDWVIDRYVERDAISMVYGPSGVGKSFVAISMACCIVTGTPWFGMSVKQGPVFYIAGEGHNGLIRRFKAWEVSNNVSLKTAPLYKTRKAIGILNESESYELKLELNEMIKKYGNPSIIIVDTVARNFGDGDENKTEDMGKFVKELDDIRAQCGCHIQIVHHSGHEGTRARGNSSLRAAVDQEYQVTQSAPSAMLLTNTKMKDAESPADRHFKIKQVEISRDKDDIPINGAYLDVDGDPLDFAVGKSKTGQEIFARDVVKAIKDGWNGYETLGFDLNCTTNQARKIVERCSQDFKILLKEGRSFVVSPEILNDPLTFILNKADELKDEEN